MNFSGTVGWWVLAGVLVAAELATGTFYLLMLALGAASGALASFMGFAAAAQLACAALVAITATAVWHWRRARSPRSAPAESNPDVNLDIGQVVEVHAWDARVQTQVKHRGSLWQAAFIGEGPAEPGAHVIAAVTGNQLLLKRKS